VVTVIMPDTAVLPISYSTSVSALTDTLKRLQPRPQRLYIWLHGGAMYVSIMPVRSALSCVPRAGADCPAAAADEQLLYWLSQLYGAVAAIHPCWDVIPLLPFAGWEAGGWLGGGKG
jgi:hypothetical protein